MCRTVVFFHFCLYVLRSQHWLEGKWMHFTHESRYLHAQLSRAAVIVQPGHFNWSAVLVPVYKPRNGFTISTDSCPTSLHRGGEAACLLSACYYWMISRVDVSSLLTRQPTHKSSSGRRVARWAAQHRSSPHRSRNEENLAVAPLQRCLLSPGFVSICFCCLCIYNVLTSGCGNVEQRKSPICARLRSGRVGLIRLPATLSECLTHVWKMYLFFHPT